MARSAPCLAAWRRHRVAAFAAAVLPLAPHRTNGQMARGAVSCAAAPRQHGVV
jgi:hypothetical protein